MLQLDLPSIELPSHRQSTNLTTYRHPIHRWYNITAGFSPEFVSKCIESTAVTRRSDVFLLDPFAGLSTALVQASFDGASAIGFEPHPFFYDVSLAKIGPTPTLSDLDGVAAVFSALSPVQALDDVWAPKPLAYLEKLIPATELHIAAGALLAERSVDPRCRMLYRLVVSAALEMSAQAQTDGIYKAPTTKKRSIPFRTAANRILSMVREDVSARVPPTRGATTLVNSSAEHMAALSDETCNLVVTSPPYLNNFDYAEMTRMELYFWRYATSWGEITERVRAKLITNTTTVPTATKKAQDRWRGSLSSRMVGRLDPLISALTEQRRIRPGKKEYDLLLLPYFAQLQTVFGEVRRVLRRGAALHLVVGDAALYGVHIPTNELLQELLVEAGFATKSHTRLRSRGDRWVLAKRDGAGKPLGEFHLHAQKR